MLLLGQNISRMWTSSEGKPQGQQFYSAMLCHSPEAGVVGKSTMLVRWWSCHSITSESTSFSVKTWYSWTLAGASLCDCHSMLCEQTFLVASAYVIFVSADRARLPEKCAVAFPSGCHLKVVLVFLTEIYCGHKWISSVLSCLHALSCLWEQLGLPDTVCGQTTCRIPWKLLKSMCQWLFQIVIIQFLQS